MPISFSLLLSLTDKETNIKWKNYSDRSGGGSVGGGEGEYAIKYVMFTHYK